jgi:hypothetical protein
MFTVDYQGALGKTQPLNLGNLTSKSVETRERGGSEKIAADKIIS